MKQGIICIETEWQITKRSNRLSLNSEPLMKYISGIYNRLLINILQTISQKYGCGP